VLPCPSSHASSRFAFYHRKKFLPEPQSLKKRFSAAVVLSLAFLFPASINTPWQSNGLLNFSEGKAFSDQLEHARLGAFSASRHRQNMIALEWRTDFERGLEGFVIERRAARAGSEFARCGYMPALGMTRRPQQYHFIDTPPGPGAYFYRLRLVDQNRGNGCSNEIACNL
jgi:hypothetical protein